MNVRICISLATYTSFYYLSPLLFIPALEALSRKIPDRDTPWELLYADDLCVSADTEEKYIERLKHIRAQRSPSEY